MEQVNMFQNMGNMRPMNYNTYSTTRFQPNRDHPNLKWSNNSNVLNPQPPKQNPPGFYNLSQRPPQNPFPTQISNSN